MSREKKLMEYAIKSGLTTEIRQVIMTVSEKRQARRAKKAKGSTLKKLLANEQGAVKQLARIINTNFGVGDLWLTLKYAEHLLPADLEAAKIIMEKFLRKCRDEYRKQTGQKLRYVLVTTDRDGKTGRKTRIHHHLVMDRMGYEVLCKFWDAEYMNFIIMDGRGDYTGIARYMCGNASGGSGEPMHGKKRWSSSQGLVKPEFTEPIPCRGLGKFKVPAGAEIKERVILEDEDTGIQSAYIRYVLPRSQPRKKEGGGGDGR